jgi:2-methylcitrate dehydratase PrpD
MSAITNTLAEFAARTAFKDLPAATIEATKRCVLDGIGVSMAGSRLGEGCAAFIDMASLAGTGPSTILGTACKASMEAAALTNGALAHALDYEDAHDGVLLHPNAPAIPAALAIAQAHPGVSGQRFIEAIALGCEVTIRMGAALRSSIADFGWYPPPILAAFGSTVAAAKILNLNADQIRDALSLTLCQATCSGEILYSPRSLIRAVRDAFPARAAVTSALLAQRGVTGFEHPLEGKAGFFATFARGEYAPQVLIDKLGESFEIERISFKPWPSCRGTHAAIEAALACRGADADLHRQIERVTIEGGPMLRMLAEPIASKQRPDTAIGAKFSLPFTVAYALVHGRVGLQSFLPEALSDPHVLALAAKVNVNVNARSGTDIGAQMRVHLESGNARECEVSVPLGSPTHPLSKRELVEKFVECAGLALQPLNDPAANRLADLILNLETLDDISRDLTPALHVD